ncbi:MAG TPA: SOS response-associated peptidase [Bacteroidales bacterium]|nr:SOS response-associated peptidase [Bacteroidales bacterium]
MCFSINVNLVKEEIESRYNAKLIDPDRYKPSYYYHAYSLPDLPVVGTERRDKIEIMKWGLIPSWVKTNEDANKIRFKTFNARAETIHLKPSFSNSFFSRRCIIPVRGFYEWQHIGERKIPWYIFRADGDIMSVAGLWSEWVQSSSGEIVRTFSIITTSANEMMARIHNSKKRMPAIIEKENEDEWLNRGTQTEKLFALLAPYPENILNAYTISNIINRKDADKNSPDIIKPFKYDLPEAFFRKNAP